MLLFIDRQQLIKNKNIKKNNKQYQFLQASVESALFGSTLHRHSFPIYHPHDQHSNKQKKVINQLKHVMIMNADRCSPMLARDAGHRHVDVAAVVDVLPVVEATVVLRRDIIAIRYNQRYDGTA